MDVIAKASAIVWNVKDVFPRKIPMTDMEAFFTRGTLSLGVGRTAPSAPHNAAKLSSVVTVVLPVHREQSAIRREAYKRLC